MRNKLSSFLLLFSALLSSSPLFAAETVRVYAASSLTNALTALIEAYQSKGKTSVVPIFGGSSALARQIELGAPADIYLSANRLWVDYLVDKGLFTQANVQDFAHNSLVVIAPSSSSVHLVVEDPNSWLSALNGQRLAIAQPNAVPAGIYAKQSLQSLDIWPSVQGQLAPTNNVRTAMTLVERGEAPLGIVYYSDALVSDQVQVVSQFGPETHQAIAYPLVTMSQNEATLAFSAFLQTQEAKQILKEFGFKE